jgi:hypothetical protein
VITLVRSCLLVGLASCHVTHPASSADVETYFVALDGNDHWSGRLPSPNPTGTDGPFATLERARDAIRAAKGTARIPPGGFVVEIRGGDYELRQTFSLSAQDSGHERSPVVYRAYAKERVRIAGGRRIARFTPVADPALVARLAPAARDHVVQASLVDNGITDFGPIQGGGLELFIDEVPMTVARWPDEGFVTIQNVATNEPVDIRGTKGDRIGKLGYAGERPSRWIDEPDGWLHGYWFWDWADERDRIESIDPARKTITLAPPYHHYGYRKGQWYYAFNLLTELDRPGEWYLDRKSGTLIVWPPPHNGRALVSVLSTLIALDHTSFVTFRNLTLEAARETAVTITDGEHDEIEACLIRNVGGWAAKISNSAQSGVSDSTITGTGQGGISIEGGDRTTLVAAGDHVVNNHIHHCSRWNRTHQPAVAVSGVGNHVAHNLIHDLPHEAINFSGNDHVIELNEIHHVCEETNDAGAVYGGRDWSMRGTEIRNNFLHDITGLADHGAVGVYLDDMLSGITVTGNVFYKVTNAAFIGGGRDNVVANNIFVDCKPALHIDARALGWAADTVDTTMTDYLRAVPYRGSVWRKRYPKLVDILGDSPDAPKGNVVARNISSGGNWDEIDDKAASLIDFEQNFVTDDPHFVDPEHMNFQLRPDSPAYTRGFKRIPIDQIGLVR